MTSLVAKAVGGVANLGAKVTYAYVEGFTFMFTRPAALLVAAAELSAFLLTAGVRLPLKVAVGTMVAAGTARGLQRLVQSLRHPDRHGDAALASIWDWEPPGGGDGGDSSAWHILRELAITANKVQASNPAIAELLNRPELAPSELGMRLYYYYSTQDQRPLLEGGSGGDGGAEEVPADLLESVGQYRAMACLPYDFDTDQSLAEELSKRGYSLLAASHAADLASGCPAYFLAVSEGRGEVALVVRGTFSPEDAFFDLLATGAPFDEQAEEEEECHAPAASARDEAADAAQRARLSGHCHSGMARAALYLGTKFGPLLRPLYAQGLDVTLVGHSLGAGVAALLAVYLRNRGLGATRLRCWAYETPACMDKDMALACADVVTSVVHGDDVVPRLCIRSFAALLEDLAAFDWQAAKQSQEAAQADSKAGASVAQHLAPLLGWALGTEGSGDGRGGKGGEEAGEGGGPSADLARLGSGGFDQPYNAHVPGQVVLIYRPPSPAPDAATVEAGSEGQDGSKGQDSSGSQASKLALVPCTHPAVRSMRVSSRMVTDHFVDSDEVVAALGG